MNILGISAFYHDSAAALVQDGRVVAAAQEERFSRVKHDADFPERSIEYCLNSANIKMADIDAVVFYEKPILKFDRILMTHLRCWPRAFRTFAEAQKLWLAGGRLKISSSVKKRLFYNGRVLFSKHHESHAAAVFYASGFEEAAVLVVDGVGEWATTSIHHGSALGLKAIEEIQFPDSLGLFYSAFTDYLGFEVNDGEYKVMGLAPYGEPVYQDILRRHFLKLNEDGSFHLMPDVFTFEHSDRMLDLVAAEKVLGFPRRDASQAITKIHQDLAASIQVILEEALLAIARRALRKTGCRRLCLAGGVALNCTANAKIHKLPELEELFIFPAAGDSGGAVGAALHAYHAGFEKARVASAFPSIYLGPHFSDEEIESVLLLAKHPFRKLSKEEIPAVTAQLLQDQKIVGWFQGRMEFGPRALGNRSILADPSRRENWPRLNRKVKFREDFRPFAPSVLLEETSRYFDFKDESPYMVMVAGNLTSKLPAVTHVDNSSRLHTVRRDDNPLYHRLIEEFGKLSGTPVLLNTSFNVSGMPIVCTPQNAIQCFFEAELDALVIGSFLLLRQDFPYLSRPTS